MDIGKFLRFLRRRFAPSHRYTSAIAITFALFAVCLVYYMIDFGSVYKEKSSPIISYSSFTDSSGEGKVNVILSAYMNSGSRFTGQLLGFHNQTFFFYEPLWKFTIWDYYKPPNVRCSTTEGSCREVETQTENMFQPNPANPEETENILPDLQRGITPVELMLDVLSRIFRCDLVQLKEIVQERVHDDLTYTGPSWQAYKLCINKFNPKSQCLHYLQRICRNKSHRIVKVLRLSVGSFTPLLEAIPRLKIVHLVRDPRAIINSRLNSRYYPLSQPRQNDSLERNLCDKMLIDILDLIKLKSKYSDRIRVIYYEDLMENLQIRLKQLYTYLNLTYDEEQVAKHTEIKVNQAHPESVWKFDKARKSNNSMWWRQFMTWDQIQAVDRRCYKVYELLGYKLLKEKEIRDSSYQTLQIPFALRL